MSQDRAISEQKQPETQLSKGPVKRYLVLDVDNTIFLNSRNYEGVIYEKLLSPTMIQFAKLGNYDGFYICTHRHLGDLDLIIDEFFRACGIVAAVSGEKRKTELEQNFENIFLVNIIKNFSEATGLPCMGVSSYDQFREKQLGTGFKTYLEPIEHYTLNSGNKDQKALPVTFLSPWPENPKLFHQRHQTINGKEYWIPASIDIIDSNWPGRNVWSGYTPPGSPQIKYTGPYTLPANKNAQLGTIADDALAKNQKGYSFLDFVDDNDHVIANACAADYEEDKYRSDLKLAPRLSDQVFLRVFKHDAYLNRFVSSPLRSTRGYWPSDFKSCSEFSAISADSLLRDILEPFIQETEGLNVSVCLILDYWFPTFLEQMKLFSPANFNEKLSVDLKSGEYEKQKARCSNTGEMIERLAQHKLIRKFPLQFIERAVVKAAEFEKTKEVYRKEDCSFFGLWKTSVLDKTEYSISINDQVLQSEFDQIAAAYKVEKPRSKPIPR